MKKILLLSHGECCFCTDTISGFEDLGFQVDYIHKSRLVPEYADAQKTDATNYKSWGLFKARAKKLQAENSYLACIYLNWDPNFHGFTPYENSLVIWLDPSHHCIGSQPYRAMTICKEGGEDYLLWGTPKFYIDAKNKWEQSGQPKPYKYSMFCRIQLSAIVAFYKQRFLPGLGSFINRTCTRYLAAQHLYSIYGDDFHLFGDADGWLPMYKMYNKDLFSASIPFQAKEAPFRQLPEFYAKSECIIDHTRPENFINPKGLIAMGLGIPLKTVVRLPHKPFIEIKDVDPNEFKLRTMAETCEEILDRAIGHKRLISVGDSGNLVQKRPLWQGRKVATLGTYDPATKKTIYDSEIMNNPTKITKEVKNEGSGINKTNKTRKDNRKEDGKNKGKN